MAPPKPTIFMTGPLQDSAMHLLHNKYDVNLHDGRLPIGHRTLLSNIHDAQGLICYPFDLIDDHIIDAAPNLKTISTYSVGFDHIDIKYAKRKNITVGYTPDVLTDATADITLALMLDVLRRVSESDRIIRRGKWTQVYGAVNHLGVDMGCKTLGILGLGRIGQAVAKRASAFGINIIYHNRNRLSVRDEKRIGAKYVTFNNLLSQSDIISVHVPYNDNTHHIFDSNVFSKMKKSAFLINTSRGKTVCESDLVDALHNGVIAGAGMDVFESEPVRRSNPLVQLQNVVLTPHIGSSTVETRSAMADITLRNLDLGMRGKKPVYSVW